MLLLFIAQQILDIERPGNELIVRTANTVLTRADFWTLTWLEQRHGVHCKIMAVLHCFICLFLH